MSGFDDPELLRADDERRAEVERRIREEWLAKLRAGVEYGALKWRQLNNGNASQPLAGPQGRVLLSLDGWDIHELYTVLVEPSGEPEGCCAGCARLPEGWCLLCDEQRLSVGAIKIYPTMEALNDALSDVPSPAHGSPELPDDIAACALSDALSLQEPDGSRDDPTRDPRSPLARICTVCGGSGVLKEGLYIASLPNGFQWFECGNHAPQDHGKVFGGDTSARTVQPLDEWRREHGL